MQHPYADDHLRLDSLSAAAHMTLSEFHNGHLLPPSTQIGDPQIELFDTEPQGDFLDQIFSSVPPTIWPDPSPTKSISTFIDVHDSAVAESVNFHYDMQSSKPQQQQQPHINPNDVAFLAKPSGNVQRHYQQQRQIINSMSDTNVFSAAEFPPRPMKGGISGGDLSMYNLGGEVGVQPLYDGVRASQYCGWREPASSPAYGLHHIQAHSDGATAAKPNQRVRARRGQATDPHSIAERLRRERIAERMKALQELVPNANKTDKASMLDEIIDHVKFLQLQVKVLSISRLGGGAASMDSNPPPLSAASQGNGEDDMAAAENHVAKLMEEDMGTAMQYLQGKGLYLMPISLATAISTASHASNSNPLIPSPTCDDPSSPTLSVLTTQSTLVPDLSPATIISTSDPHT